MSATLVLAAILIAAISGVPALAAPRLKGVSTVLIALASVLGLAGAAIAFTAPSWISARWSIPGAWFSMEVDALSAFFLVPLFVLAFCASLYAEGYWPQSKPLGCSLRFFFGLVIGGLALVMTAHNAILFLVAWEIVAVGAFFLVSADSDDPEVRRSSWLYLAASHVATLALFGAFSLMHASTGSWALESFPAGFAASAAGMAVFWLALVGFGTKAGLMPLHVWLPGAHAGAPSHVSAIMSGIVIKMGVYGIVRLLSLYDATPQWMGATLVAFGLVSSVFGVAFALAQHDLKRLLAYHSIENIGIIITGIGVGCLGIARGEMSIAFLGFAGGLLHVWNHALFKSLLFLGAGSAVHATGTREIDRMGGLAKLMPWTSAAFLTGAVAISGLPPLNGFVSEWLVYVGSFNAIQSEHVSIALIAVAPALALTGALALACFVKAFGVVFLGAPRTPEAASAHEGTRSMRAAMLPLAVACIFIGVAPALVVPVAGTAVLSLAGIATQTVPGLDALQIAMPLLAVALIAMTALLLSRTRGSARTPTWDCGYAAPTPRMQYTSSSLAKTIVGFFAWAMPAVVHAPHGFTLFPAKAEFESHVPDTVLDRGIRPLLARVARVASYARHVQSGRMQLYLLYLAVTLIALLVWSFR